MMGSTLQNHMRHNAEVVSIVSKQGAFKVHSDGFSMKILRFDLNDCVP